MLLCFQVEWNLRIYFFHVCGRLHITTATDTVLVRWIFILYASSSLFKYLSCMWTYLHFILKKVCWKNNDWLYVCIYIYISQRKSYLLSLKVSSPILTALHSGWKLYNYTAFGLMALGNLWFQFPEILVSLNYRVNSILLKVLYSSLPDIVLSFWMLILSYFYFSDKKEQGKGKFQWCIIISYIHIYLFHWIGLDTMINFPEIPVSHFQDCDFYKQFLTERM